MMPVVIATGQQLAIRSGMPGRLGAAAGVA